MLTYRIEEEERIVIIELSGPISRQELDALARDVDRSSRRWQTVRGLVVRTRSFPRWRDPVAFLRDMRFVLGHQRTIERVASVTDSKILSLVHRVLHHVLSPEIRHFAYRDEDAALQWMREKR